jgi:ubiquinone/menaquinone biosynthesis C-methylase UbiE
MSDVTKNQVAAIRKGYDAVAEEYARRIFAELDQKPLDRELLTRFAERVRGKGAVCDVGCGPGHVARFLHDAGAKVFGLDLSPGMIAVARRLSPQVSFREGNMLALDLPDQSLAGITAFYAIVNLPEASRPAAFREMARALSPGGWLLLAHHIGAETVHCDAWWEQPVDLDFHFFDSAVIARELEAAGLVVKEIVEREPYAPEVEHQSRRAYIFARRV